jgi:MoxR-like ATPase/uncharacterized protein (DUF2461 family)
VPEFGGGVSDGMQQDDSTPAVLARVRDTFAEQFVSGRIEAEKAAVDLLNERAGELTREEATRLGQLFNTHVKAGQVRQDRFLPAFAGATIQKVTEDLERFNEVVADLWTATIDTALDTLGRMYADRSVLPGAGSSLPSMLLYLRDPERFGICINATMRGLAAALGPAPFRADSRASYEEFCRALRQWRDRYGIAPQEADAVLTDLWRETRGERLSAAQAVVFGDRPLRFLAEIRANNSGAWMEANRGRYQTELRQPFVALLEQIAVRHMRELDPQLDTTIKTNRVLASIRKRFPDAQGEYYDYFWGAFSRGRKQEDVQFAVLAEPSSLQVSLYFGSARPDQLRRLRDAVAHHGDALLAPVSLYHDRIVWELHSDREHPLERPAEHSSVAEAADMLQWLDAGGNSIKWPVPLGDPLLDDPDLADRIGEFFRTVHPFAAAAWGDPFVDTPTVDATVVEEEVHDDEKARPSLEEVAARCYLRPEVVEEWVTALNGTMRQGLFYGPPGTGKTYVATELARHLASSPEHVETVQFHSSYSYEDFIEGLRPDTVGDSGTLRYVIRPGLFQEFCTRARAAANDSFVLVIDEMNRADLAAVFGELLLLLEYRGDWSVRLPYSQRRFTVPRNVIVLGTMNTADRSLALVDFALRRRFNAFRLDPSPDVLAGWAKEHPDADTSLLLSLFQLIRDRVGADNPVAPGHSYWMVVDADAATAERIWAYQVRPYLAEHWFERPEELARLDQDVQALIAEQS